MVSKIKMEIENSSSNVEISQMNEDQVDKWWHMVGNNKESKLSSKV